MIFFLCYFIEQMVAQKQKQLLCLSYMNKDSQVRAGLSFLPPNINNEGHEHQNEPRLKSKLTLFTLLFFLRIQFPRVHLVENMY